MDILKFNDENNIIQNIYDSTLIDLNISLSILRLDLINLEISGNKWYKLKYNLLSAREEGYKTILSFGGAWSNHLHAMAAAGRIFKFKTIGVVRGEDANTPCLSDAEANGMTLHRVTRAQYRNKTDQDFIESLHKLYGDFFLIPEGGGNLAGIRGCGEILSSKQADGFDSICLPCGTGSTLTGLICGQKTPVLGFQVLKGQGYLTEQINNMLNQYQLQVLAPWAVNDTYHCGGYARTTEELLNFIVSFELRTGIPLEPVYSGKLLFGVYDLIKTGYFKEYTKILAIHGGGLQGRRGFPA